MVSLDNVSALSLCCEIQKIVNCCFIVKPTPEVHRAVHMTMAKMRPSNFVGLARWAEWFGWRERVDLGGMGGQLGAYLRWPGVSVGVGDLYRAMMGVEAELIKPGGGGSVAMGSVAHSQPTSQAWSTFKGNTCTTYWTIYWILVQPIEPIELSWHTTLLGFTLWQGEKLFLIWRKSINRFWYLHSHMS